MTPDPSSAPSGIAAPSGVAAPFGVAAPPRPPRDAFDAALHADPGAPRTIEVGIPMRDGVELAADIHLPAASALPAPAIVLGTPYDKSGPIEDVRQYRDAGYVAIAYDVRGRGKSEGEWRAFVNDPADGHDVVEWVAAQDFCSGEVGVTGLSYSGWVVWATASQRPPHLKAAVSTSAAGRWQEEIPYTHGCFQLYFAYWVAAVRRRILDDSVDVASLVDVLPVDDIGTAINAGGSTWRDLMDHDTLDELWRSIRWDGAYDGFDVPTLHVTGWHDREDIHGAFHHYEQMMAASPARDRQWLLVGPWPHVSCRFPAEEYKGERYPGAALDMTAIHLRFFDRFLRGAANGVDDEPRVRLYDPGTREWKVRDAWKAGTRDHQLHLADGGVLAPAPGGDASTSFRYDPREPAGVRFDVRDTPWEPPLDLGELEAQDGVVTWTSEPLAEALTVHGWGELELFAATDGDDTDWHVKLADVDAGGRSLAVAWGCLRASYAADPSAPAPVQPGAVERYAIELTPTFHTFAAGHRLRVVLASSDWPWFARSLNRAGSIAGQADARTATNTVHHGAARPSRLRLPVEA
jgi:putative CocE/NonD family hydrolase